MTITINGKTITSLQQTFRKQGMLKVLVVKPGQLENLKGIKSLKESSSDIVRATAARLTELIKNKYGIEITDILCDPAGRLPILSADPPFIARIQISGGQLDVLAHTVVLEMEDTQTGKLYLLRGNENIKNISKLKRSRRKKADTLSNVPFKQLWEAVQEIEEPSLLEGKTFEVGEETEIIAEITNANPENFTFEIYFVVRRSRLPGTERLPDTYLPLKAKVIENGIRLYFEEKRFEKKKQIIEVGTIGPETRKEDAPPKTITSVDTKIPYDIEDINIYSLVYGLRSIISREIHNLWQTLQQITNFGPLFNRKFKAGKHTLEILDPNPKNFTFEIENVKCEERDDVTREYFKDGYYTLQAQIREDNLILISRRASLTESIFSPAETDARYEFLGGDSWICITKDLNLRQIIDALLKEIERYQA